VGSSRAARPAPPASISLVPAGSPVRVRASECKDQLFIFLEPGLVARVAAEAIDPDPARVSVPPLDSLDLPPLRAAMGAVGAELTAGAHRRGAVSPSTLVGRERVVLGAGSGRATACRAGGAGGLGGLRCHAP
jgi:hypothetical protein